MRRITNPIDCKPRKPSRRAIYLAWRDTLPWATREQPCEGRIHPRNRWTIDGENGVWGRMYDHRRWDEATASQMPDYAYEGYEEAGDTGAWKEHLYAVAAGLLIGDWKPREVDDGQAASDRP